MQRAAIYLDSNACAPLSAGALNAISATLPLLLKANVDLPHSPSFLLPNPSSQHSHGRQARRWLNHAREQVARSLGASVRPEELVFTSSGTEANQWAVRSVLEPLIASGKKPHWILSSVEHDSCVQLVEWLTQRGGSVSFLPVDSEGRLLLEALEGLWRPETALVSAIWVNNETGVITDVAALSREVARRGVPLHLDGAQAWGKLELDLGASGASLVSFSGHKIGALAGTGVLWISRDHTGSRESLLRGKQESGRRGGTENLLGAVSLGGAASVLDPLKWALSVAPLRERLESEIRAQVPGARIHGVHAPRVANTINLGFEGVEKDGLVMALDLAGFSVSSGSACSSGVTSPSHVLMAMGLSEAQARSAVRISLLECHTWEELAPLVAAIARSVERMR